MVAGDVNHPIPDRVVNQTDSWAREGESSDRFGSTLASVWLTGGENPATRRTPATIVAARKSLCHNAIYGRSGQPPVGMLGATKKAVRRRPFGYWLPTPNEFQTLAAFGKRPCNEPREQLCRLTAGPKTPGKRPEMTRPKAFGPLFCKCFRHK